MDCDVKDSLIQNLSFDEVLGQERRADLEGWDMSFDYHRAMTNAVVETQIDPERLMWIMNETNRARYRHFLKHEMGVEPDDSESFGIPIQTGEPSNGEPFELVVRPIS